MTLNPSIAGVQISSPIFYSCKFVTVLLHFHDGREIMRPNDSEKF